MAKKKIPEPTHTLETFRDIRGYSLDQFRKEEPSCGNGIVSVDKYRITVEKIVEPPEVIYERLETLWVTSENHHDYLPLMRKAEEVGYTFKGQYGQNDPRRKK